MVRNHGFPCLLNGIMEKNHGKCPNHDHGKTPSFAKFTYSTLPHSTLPHSTIPFHHSTLLHSTLLHSTLLQISYAHYLIPYISNSTLPNLKLSYSILSHSTLTSPEYTIIAPHHPTHEYFQPPPPSPLCTHILTFISFQLIYSTCTWLWFIYNIYPLLGLLWCLPGIY